MKEYSKILLAVIITFGVSISAQSLMANWAEPGDDPPNANPEKPINVSGDYQEKVGPLGIAGDLLVAGKVRSGTQTQDIDLDSVLVTLGYFKSKKPSLVQISFNAPKGSPNFSCCPGGYLVIGARSGGANGGTIGYPSNRRNPMTGYIMCLRI